MPWCTDMYIIRTAKSMSCMYHVQTRIYNNECKYFIHTMFRPYIYTNIKVFVYVCVHTCLDHVYTMYIHGMYNFNLPWTRNTKRKSIAKSWVRTHDRVHNSQRNHYPISMLASNTIVTVCIYCFTWLGRAVTRCRTSRTPRPPGRHDVACPSINMDLFKAEVRGEAGLAETVCPKQP